MAVVVVTFVLWLLSFPLFFLLMVVAVAVLAAGCCRWCC